MVINFTKQNFHVRTNVEMGGGVTFLTLPSMVRNHAAIDHKLQKRVEKIFRTVQHLRDLPMSV